MNDVELRQYILDTFKGTDVVVASDDSYLFYNPDPNVPPDHKFPFVTIVTSDMHDQVSNLNRPSVYRLNIGVSKQTFRSLFGLPERDSEDDTAESGENQSKYDYTALDQVMPHPVYGMMYWVCILNPNDETFDTKVLPLLTEAYDMAVSKYNKQAARK